MYLNTIYFGHACYGIAGAADFYFSKPASSLSAAEAATLAAIIKITEQLFPVFKPGKVPYRTKFRIKADANPGVYYRKRI